MNLLTRLCVIVPSVSSWVAELLIGVATLLAVAVLTWLALKKYVRPGTPEERKETVTLLFQILGGTAFLLGAYFTWQQLVISREDLKTTQQGQITDRFSRAIEQLGKEEESENAHVTSGANPQKYLAIRLGGIYALEQIARDYKPDHPAIMEVLTAFVRERSPRLEAPGAVQHDVRPDVQAILTVLGRRELTYGKGESQRLNLSGTDLSWAILNNARLDGADLTSAQLNNAQLKNAEFRQAILLNADFSDAILEGAKLQGADLRGAIFNKAKLTGVDFRGANLSGADLTDSEGLTKEQLDSAITDSFTRTSRKEPG